MFKKSWSLGSMSIQINITLRYNKEILKNRIIVNLFLIKQHN